MIRYLFSILLLFSFTIVANSQDKPKIIYLSFNKTVHLLFNSKVKYIDAGIDDILFKKEDNMAKIATKVENFPETSLIVKTVDEIIYSFIIRYASNSDTLIYNIPVSSGLSLNKNINTSETKIVTDSVSKVKADNDTLEKVCKKVLGKKQTIKDLEDIENDIFVSLTNIFVYHDMLFFHFKVINYSNINYDVDCFNLSITNKKS